MEVAAQHPAPRVISARGKVVTPGLVDSHIHTTFQMSRGLADEVGSKQFLFERMYPYEAVLVERHSTGEAYEWVLDEALRALPHSDTAKERILGVNAARPLGLA